MRIDRVTFAAALARADLNVKQLAQLSGVSRVTVSSVETGKSCSADTVNKTAAILGRDIIEDTAATVSNVKLKDSESISDRKVGKHAMLLECKTIGRSF